MVLIKAAYTNPAKLLYGLTRLCLVTAAICFGHVYAQAQPATPWQSFEQTLTAWQAQLLVPGINALILQGDSTVYHQAFGYADLEAKTPLTTGHAFPIASITKTFAATLALQCVQQGRFKLTDKVVDLLPEQTGKLDERILVRHILSHTSELTPGTEFNYSGRYGLIKDVLEKTTGKSFAVLIEKTFIRPLNLTGTQPGLGKPGYEAQWGNVVKGYSVRNNPYRMAYAPHTDSGLGANTGLVSTTADLARYFVALKNGQFFDKQSVSTLWAPPVDAHGQPLPVGVAWFTRLVTDGNGRPVRVAWSFGQLGNVSTLLMTVPETDYTLILLSNSPALSDAFRHIEGDCVFSPVIQSFWQAIGLLPPTDSTNRQTVSRFFADGYTHANQAGQTPKQVLKAYWRTNLYRRSAPHLALLVSAVQQGATRQAGLSRLARALVRAHPQNPKHIYFAANYYLRAGLDSRARKAAAGVEGWQNVQRGYFSAGCYLAAAEAFIKKDPPRAKCYAQTVLEWSGYADQTTRARELLDQLPKKR